MESNNLVKCMVIASEKSARIARICRQNKHLLTLLVQEKTTKEKNPRFVQDFKTLADVLVQETIKHDLGKKFPELFGFIHGEESNKFTNSLGDSVTVSISDVQTETTQLLSRILDGDDVAANLITEEIYKTVSFDDCAFSNFSDVDIPADQLEIWIDPIDSTAEYISGISGSLRNGIAVGGLSCVTVLIGVYDRYTGTPIFGVINQPFSNFVNGLWTGKVFYGLSYNGLQVNSFTSSVDTLNGNKKVIAISSSEKDVIKSSLIDAGFTLIEPAGAGYKLLCVILGLVDAYVLSRGTTYFWDTCACQAVLKSVGGTIWAFSEAVESNNFEEILYHGRNNKTIEEYCNKKGIIACRNIEMAKVIAKALKSS